MRMTMSVVSVKVPQKVKEEMEKMKGSVKWPDEIRNFILDKLEQEKRIEIASKVERNATGNP